MTDSAAEARQEYWDALAELGYLEFDERLSRLDAAVLALMVEMGRRSRQLQPRNFHDSISWQLTYERVAQALLKGEELEKP